MPKQRALTLENEGPVNNLTFDLYGRRAVCSNKSYLSVFDYDSESTNFSKIDSWKAHTLLITKIIVTKPKFGSSIISLSRDQTVKIWKENENEFPNSGKRWCLNATIQEILPIHDIEILPTDSKLTLMLLLSNGNIKILESKKFTDFQQWHTVEEINLGGLQNELSSYGMLRYTNSVFGPPKIAIVDNQTRKIAIFCQEGTSWKLISLIIDHEDLILDMKWAPNMGKIYDFLATACRDGELRIFKVNRTSDPSNPLEVDLNASFVLDSAVTGLCWNLSGSTLTCTDDVGNVSTYKCSYSGEWKEIPAVDTGNQN